MNVLVEALSALQGSLMLALRRPDSFLHFNATVGGFWRSFLAVLAIAPLYLYADAVDARHPLPGTEAVPPAPVASLVMLLLQWAAWPLFVALLTRGTRLAPHFARYVTVYNWSSLLVFAVMLVPLVMLDLGLIGVNAAAGASAVLLIVALWYRWLVAVMALEATAWVAVALVVADVAVSLALHRLIGA
jgi:hypothetical protein